MKLLEYEAKAILRQHTIPVPASQIVKKQVSEMPVFPVVLKSQVPTGGRGKAGGIVIVKNQKQYKETVKKLFKLPIKSHLPHALIAEECLNIRHEYYLSILLDKPNACITFMAHKNGGVEVEENPTDSYAKIPLNDHPDFETIGTQLAECFNLPDKTFVLQDLAENLFICFVKNDALLIEINPFVLTKDNMLVAGDCKIELDDAAQFRHKDWEFVTKRAEVNFVTLDKKGNVATIANGAGLAMATVDAVADTGLIPANFLDIGGGANESSVLAAFERIMTYPDVKVIIINIFAGITRCDEVARAIIAARTHIPNLPPLSIRLAGTNFNEAVELLEKESIPVLATLEDCLSYAKKVIK